jgi:membrane associated rhomboid family serine protease
MIPLSDASRRLLNFPIVTVLIIAANAVMFLFELALGDAFINRWSLVLADIMAGRISRHARARSDPKFF